MASDPVTANPMIRSDVLVWGGGSGGVAAALQAARSGATTTLLTPGSWLGGMVSAAGVSAPDGHELSCWQTGIWGALLRELRRCEARGLDQNWVSCFGYRPELAETILQRWVAREQNLQWLSECQLLQIDREGERIQRLHLLHQQTTLICEATVLIDGSDLGDLLGLAAVPNRWGWEAAECWGEPSAPSQDQLDHDRFFAEQPVQSPTWVVMGQLREDREPPRHTDAPAAPFSSSTKAFGFEKTLTYGRLPGGLVMLNWPLNGNDWHHDLGRSISEDPAERRQLHTEMQEHSLAFLEALIQCSDGWLEPGQAFPGDNSSLALMPYWREGRRLIGHSTVTENDLLPVSPGALRGPLPMDATGRCTSIAVGTYANDHHYPGEDWPLAAKSCRWGGRWTGTPFCIPFDALSSPTASNLLVADKAFSVSHMANGATRLQPLILNIGQAAGLAAALAVERQCCPIDLPVELVQTALLTEPTAPAAVLPIWDWPIWHPQWLAAQRLGLMDPSQLDPMGCLRARGQTTLDLPLPAQRPNEAHERLYSGELITNADGSFCLRCAADVWPVITLEPAVHRWFQALDPPTTVHIRGVLNPWGPWLRVIGLVD